jgi:hypothetical protein
MPRSSLLALALLLPFLSRAGDAPSTSPDPSRSFRRLLIRPGAADAQVQEVLVAGGVTTIIRTPWGLHRRRPASLARSRPAPTFELLVGRGKVVVTPTRALVPGERFALVLRLEDDTVVPLALVGAARAAADGEVRVVLDPNDSEELRVQLAAATSRAQGLEAQLRQALQEQDSEDFALAGLLAGGHEQLTSLEKVRERQLVEDPRGRITVATYAPGAAERHGPRKVSVVVSLLNRGPEAVAIGADLFAPSTLAMVPFAARAFPARVAPGGTGTLSVVLDEAALDADLELVLQLHDGRARTELRVDLSVADFATSSWWRF